MNLNGGSEMRLQLDGIAYKQGGRQMVVTAMDPSSLVKMVRQPDTWDPLGKQPHGNRPRDKKHQAGIAEYLEAEEDFVLGAVVLYASPRDATFEPNDEHAEDEIPCPGTLLLNYGAQFDVGDGQHRIAAYADVMGRHDEDNDRVHVRLRSSGQPVVIVIDDSPLHRAQDFTDLQRNAKPPTGSLGMSMDRRQAINRFCVALIQGKVPIFDEGERVEFLKDSPGKLSAKLFSFKTVRYVTGTALNGVGERSTKAWESAANTAVDSNGKAMEEMTQLWGGLGAIPGFKRVISGKGSAAELREKTRLTSAGVLYAMAFATYRAHTKDGLAYGDAAKALASVDFDRPVRKPTEQTPLTKKETPFAGTLVDPATGKIGSGRPSWEAAALDLHQAIIAASK